MSSPAPAHADAPPPPPTPLPPSAHPDDNKAHLLLCASGSVATIKLPQILHALSAYPRLSIRLILTPSATRFLAGQSAEQPLLSTLAALPHVAGVHLDAHEWAPPWTRGAGVLHIELRRWAHLMVVAPLGANSLAKLCAGLCDNLLLSTMRAWDTTGELDAARAPQLGGGGGDGGGATVADGTEAPPPAGRRARPKTIALAPAMNTAMWRHPATRRQMRLLEGEWNVAHGGWIEVLRPVEKELACGDTGDGAMRDWRDVVALVVARLALREGGEGEAEAEG